MNSYMLPAGLLDDRVEFFNDPNDRERCFALVAGQVYPVNQAPESILNLIDADMSNHPEKIEALVALGFETQEELREKYCSCCFGAFDGEADIIDSKLIHTEYWPCPVRGNCAAEGTLCNALNVGEGKFLTRREVEVLTLAGRCLLGKEIAAELGISEETVKVHLKHIREKAGLDNIQDLVKLAIKKNLV